MDNRTSLQADILAMNVSWFHEDLKLFENSFDLTLSLVLTLVRFITLILAVIVHRAFYKLMKRLPGRAVNQIIFPYMVSYHSSDFRCQPAFSCFQQHSSEMLFTFANFSDYTIYLFGTLHNLSLNSSLGVSIEGLHWR